MKIRILVLMIGILFGCAAGKETTKSIADNTETARKPILIRIKNETNHDMTDVLANIQGRVVKYGDIKRREYSKYISVARAYGYAYVEWHSNNVKKMVVPEDFVGEKELTGGKYTYIVYPHNGDGIYHSIRLQEDSPN